MEMRWALGKHAQSYSGSTYVCEVARAFWHKHAFMDCPEEDLIYECQKLLAVCAYVIYDWPILEGVK